jgi:NAD+ synthase
MITISDVINSINYESAVEEIKDFILAYIDKAKARGVVVGLSGGVDSSLTARLAVEALGRGKVTAFILPTKATPREDVEDAVALARLLGITYYMVEVDPILKAFENIPEYDVNDRVARGNLTARVRMSILYYYANRHNLLVMGTGDKSELMLGYITKYGDGGVDLLPIGDLYKTQVREMARRLNLPTRVVTKPSSPRLWVGQTAEGELGVSYTEADVVLYALEIGTPQRRIAEVTGVEPQKIRAILRRVKENAHKRQPPPTAQLTKSRLYTKRAIKGGQLKT